MALRDRERETHVVDLVTQRGGWNWSMIVKPAYSPTGCSARL